MNNNTSIEALKEKRKFTTTKIVEILLKNKQDISELLDTIDFTEKSTKKIQHQFKENAYPEYITVNESLACNIVENLDFDLYNPLMRADWIMCSDTNDYNPIFSHLLYHNKFTEYNHLLSLVTEHINNKYPKFKYINTDYQKQHEPMYFLKIVSDSILRHYLSFNWINEKTKSKDIIVSFEKIINLFSLAYNETVFSIYNNPKQKKINTNINNWHKQLSTIETFAGFKGYNKRSEFNLNLVSKRSLFTIFENAYSQYLPTENNPFHNKDILMESLFSLNFEVFNILIKNDKYDKKEINDSFSIRIKEYIETTKELQTKPSSFNNIISTYHSNFDVNIDNHLMPFVLAYTTKATSDSVFKKQKISFDTSLYKISNGKQLSINEMVLCLYLTQRIIKIIKEENKAQTDIKTTIKDIESNLSKNESYLLIQHMALKTSISTDLQYNAITDNMKYFIQNTILKMTNYSFDTAFNKQISNAILQISTNTLINQISKEETQTSVKKNKI